MGKLYDELDDRLTQFIEQQKMFFVATAPLSANGHVNLSPKGLDSFRILGPTSVAYLDLVGSGAETIAHLRENGRITFMFCAFEGPPNILRLYGEGVVAEPGDPSFAELSTNFPSYDAARAIIHAKITRITDSCGFGVPRYTYEGERDQLFAFTERKGADGLKRYQLDKNLESIDGLPALRGTKLRE